MSGPCRCLAQSPSLNPRPRLSTRVGVCSARGPSLPPSSLSFGGGGAGRRAPFKVGFASFFLRFAVASNRRIDGRVRVLVDGVWSDLEGSVGFLITTIKSHDLMLDFVRVQFLVVIIYP